jgi:hypothetical protein
VLASVRTGGKTTLYSRRLDAILGRYEMAYAAPKKRMLCDMLDKMDSSLLALMSRFPLMKFFFIRRGGDGEKATTADRIKRGIWFSTMKEASAQVFSNRHWQTFQLLDKNKLESAYKTQRHIAPTPLSHESVGGRG